MLSISHFRFAVLALSMGLLLGTTACDRDKDKSVTSSEEIASAEDQAAVENDDASASELIDENVPTDLSRALPADSMTSVSASGCATRSWDPVTRTLTIDFGTTNCVCRDGRTRRGKLIAVFTGQRFTPGSSVAITRDNYYVNDNQHLGTRTITYTDYNIWDVQVRNAGIVFASNGGTTTWQADRHVTRTALPGQPTTFTVTGTASGTNRNGISYTATIQNALVRRLQTGCANVFVDGTVEIVKQVTETGRTLLLNYDPVGGAPCDRVASVTVNGRSRTITLR